MTRFLLAQLAPIPGEPAANLDRLGTLLRGHSVDAAIAPELFLSGYRIGDRFHGVAVRRGDAVWTALTGLASDLGMTLVVGAPLASPERSGELQNAALVVAPSGKVAVQAKRYLPTFGPFEEGVPFSLTARSRPCEVGGHRAGVAICYDTFFPEVFRGLALGGADAFLVLSASPVPSGPLFARLLPARAIENGVPIVYVNRVGVEDGIVFGGGSGAWDPRGEALVAEELPDPRLAPEERLLRVDIDLDEPARWRPFRPVLRDVAQRPPTPEP